MSDRIDEVLLAVGNLTEILKQYIAVAEAGSINIEVEQSEKLDLLYAALCETQKEMPTAKLNKINSRFKDGTVMYADFTAIVQAARPYMAKNGLSVIDYTVEKDGNPVKKMRLCHNSGQFINSSFVYPKTMNIQEFSSVNTYAMRILFKGLVGVVVEDEDDDGNAAYHAPAPVKPKAFVSDRITNEQLEILEHELTNHDDITERLKKAYNITQLEHLKKSDYLKCLDQVREIKAKLKAK